MTDYPTQNNYTVNRQKSYEVTLSPSSYAYLTQLIVDLLKGDASLIKYRLSVARYSPAKHDYLKDVDKSLRGAKEMHLPYDGILADTALRELADYMDKTRTTLAEAMFDLFGVSKKEKKIEEPDDPALD